MNTMKNIHIFGPTNIEARGPVISFQIDNIHPHDLGTFLDHEGIAIRTGHHCAQPLHHHFKISASNRISFSFYNTFQEIDHLLSAIKKATEFFQRSSHHHGTR